MEVTTDDLKRLLLSELKTLWRLRALELPEEHLILTVSNSFTMKNLDGTWSRKKLRSGVTLKPLGFYQGKKSGVICRFQPIHRDYMDCEVEIPLASIPAMTSHYTTFLQTLLGKTEHQAKRKKEIAMKQETNKAIPGWGAFS